MLRPSTSQRRVLGLALAVTVGTGIGLGAPSLLSASDTPQISRAQVAARTATTAGTAGTAGTASTAGTAGTATTEIAPANAPAPSSPLTLEEAKAVAAQVAPAESSSGTRTTSRRAFGST